jgi:hypothetical protein
MSEEQNAVETNDGTWTGLKKTIIGVLTTIIMGAGTYITTTLFNGGGEEKTEQSAQAPAPVVVNIENTNQQKQMTAPSGNTTIIKERVVEKAVESKKTEKNKSETEDSPW